MKKCVVTGANGFIGFALVKRLLERGDRIFAITHSQNRLQEINNERLTVILRDFNDYSGLAHDINEDVDVVYHLAWSGYGTHTQDPYTQFSNILPSIKLLECAVDLNAKFFISTGSSHEYQIKPLPADESKSYHCSIYGVAKNAFRKAGRIIALNNNIHFFVTTFSHVYGWGDYNNRSSYKIISSLLRNESPILAPGYHLYDWVYIDDAVDGLIAVASSTQRTADYYVGSQCISSFEDLITNIRDIIAPSVKLRFGEYNEDAIIDYTLMDLNALYQDTGFKIVGDLKDKINKTVEWIKIR